MGEDIERVQSDIFVVRVLSGEGTILTGQIQHVATGEKSLFRGLEELGGAIAQMKRKGTAGD